MQGEERGTEGCRNDDIDDIYREMHSLFYASPSRTGDDSTQPPSDTCGGEATVDDDDDDGGGGGGGDGAGGSGPSSGGGGVGPSTGGGGGGGVGPSAGGRVYIEGAGTSCGFTEYNDRYFATQDTHHGSRPGPTPRSKKGKDKEPETQDQLGYTDWSFFNSFTSEGFGQSEGSSTSVQSVDSYPAPWSQFYDPFYVPFQLPPPSVFAHSDRLWDSECTDSGSYININYTPH